MADENLYRARAERGEVQIGTWVNMIRTPSVLMLLRAAGLDFARIDMEHSPFSMETVADMAALARAMNFPMVVRPPEGNREWITRLLDAGVWNLHVPQVDTPEQAREVAACCRYAPLGERGMYGFGPNTEFRARPLAEHTAHANARVHEARRDRGHAGDRRADDRADRPRPRSRRARHAGSGRGARRAPPPSGGGGAQARQGGGDADRHRGGRAPDDQPRRHHHQLLVGRRGPSIGLRVGGRRDPPDGPALVGR